MVMLNTQVVEPAYGFYYLLCGLLGSGFLAMIVGIFIYFWKNQSFFDGRLQQIAIDQALTKKDVDQIAKDLVDIKSSLKEYSQHSPAALQEAVFELVERMKGIKK